MVKRIKVSDTKAYKIEGIKIDGQKMANIRQFYATQKDPTFKPGRQGVTIPLEKIPAVIEELQAMLDKSYKFSKIEKE